MTRLSPDQLNALKDRHPVADLAAQWVTLRRKRAGEYVGPCPICSDDPHSKTAARFKCDSNKWLCAVCSDGGDVIALVMKRDGVDFAGAIERLGGVRAEAVTPPVAERRGLQAHRSGAGIGDCPAEYDDSLSAAWCRGWRSGEKRAGYAAMARERERQRLLNFCAGARPYHDAPALQAYFRGRGLDAPPPGARLGWHPDMPYFADGRENEPLLIHRGSAMLAPILAPGDRFAGMHITWLDANGPKGKARLIHPETGAELPAKKVRGSKAGGWIDLGGCHPADLNIRMIAGEGIETVMAVHTALRRAGRDLSRTLFRSGVDLGNLCGRALETVRHPALKDAAGRARRVPGLEPDLAAPAMPVPSGISELILLGDGDSDPFLTHTAMARAAARHAQPGRRVAVRFAPDGKDFDDMIEGQQR